MLAPQLPFGIRSDHRDQDLYATRIAANAARAIGLGLGRMRSAEPPALYAFDPDTGRLAVTTPRYSTAIVPDNHGAFAYGGIELARLFGPGPAGRGEPRRRAAERVRRGGRRCGAGASCSRRSTGAAG